MKVKVMSFDQFLNEIDENMINRNVALIYAQLIEDPIVHSRQFYINRARLHILPAIKETSDARQYLESVIEKYNPIVQS